MGDKARNEGTLPTSRRRFRAIRAAAAVALGFGLLVGSPCAAGLVTVHNFAPLPPATPSALVGDGNGYLYGTTQAGGTENLGTVFRVRTDGSGFLVVHDFEGSDFDGARPEAPLVVDGACNLFGTTVGGGTLDNGTVFTTKCDGSGFTLLHSFLPSGAEGMRPRTALVLDGSGHLYGTTATGGAHGRGTVFRINTDGTGFTVLHDSLGFHQSSLVLDGGGTLYGTFQEGGAANFGGVFSIKTDGTDFTVLHEFAGDPTDGSTPRSAPALGPAGFLCGTTSSGGVNGAGTIYSLKTDGTVYAVLHSFGGSSQAAREPYGELAHDGAGNLFGTTFGGGDLGAGTVFRVKADGSSFATLHSFAGGPTDGQEPVHGVWLDGEGQLFGATPVGGSSYRGVLYGVSTDGADYHVVRDFVIDPTNGRTPEAALVADDAGRLYGTTRQGGTWDLGTVFSLNPGDWAFSVLHGFAGDHADGSWPWAALAVGAGGRLYGTTSYGGPGDDGTVFGIGVDGAGLSLVHGFIWENGDGLCPASVPLLDADGYLYGTTRETVFRVRTDGSGFEVLHTFGVALGDGMFPGSQLALDDGYLYGTTLQGGDSDGGTIFKLRTDGSTYEVLRSFTAGVGDGVYPGGYLASDGVGHLFGTTRVGGPPGGPMVFRLKTDGTEFTVLHRFPDGTPGGFLVALDGRGNVIGATSAGGVSNLGTLFTLKTDGTGFALLHEFTGYPTEGSSPMAPPLRRGNTLYGTTEGGGVGRAGTVYALVNPQWKGGDTPAIYRSSDRSWYLKNGNSGGAADLVFPYGDPSDQAVKGDWDGDGDDTVGIYRDGVFFLKNTNEPGNADLVIGFGAPGDIPIAGDWDGDGIDTIGVYRPSEAAWFLRNTNTPGPPDLSFTYGLSNETPVAGDWDGDGIDTVGIFRASDRQWYLHNSNAGGNAELVFPYGDPAQDVPVVGDWDGDGDDTVGIYRASLGEWFIRNTNTAGNSDLNFTYGLVNEKPLAGDWDGN